MVLCRHLAPQVVLLLRPLLLWDVLHVISIGECVDVIACDSLTVKRLFAKVTHKCLKTCRHVGKHHCCTTTHCTMAGR